MDRSNESLLDRYPQRNPAVAWRVIDDEAILVDAPQGIFRVLNAVGSRIWELADGEVNLEEVSQAIAGEFGVDSTQALRDVVEFVSELQDKGLVTWRIEPTRERRS